VVLGRIQHIGWIRDKEDIKTKAKLTDGLDSVLHRMPELVIKAELEDNIYQKILIKNLPDFRKVFLFLNYEIALAKKSKNTCIDLAIACDFLKKIYIST
jgi:hypothetical protein